MAFLFEMQTVEFTRQSVKQAVREANSSIFDFAHAAMFERSDNRVALNVLLNRGALQGKADDEIRAQMEKELSFLAELPVKVADIRLTPVVRLDVSKLLELKMPVGETRKGIEIVLEMQG